MREKRGQPKTTGVEQARALFAGAGLEFPLIPNELAPRFRQRGEWCFSTRPVRHSPYDIDWYVQAAQDESATDYVLLAHAGHGINSYAIHYYLSRSPLRLLVQVGWGGSYMDNEEATSRVKKCFALAGDLVEAIGDACLEAGQHLIVIAADFNGCYWRLSDFAERRATSIDGRLEPETILSQVLEWCRLRAQKYVPPGAGH